MPKIGIIGIDGLDPVLLYKWRDVLPNFSSMYNDISDITIESTFPPDSICAWTSIFTGENPAEHGLIESINYLSSKKISGDNDRAAHFRGRTFWDTASENGKTVCIINPFIAYPAWKVRGVMVSGPVFEGGEISTYPERISNRYKFPALGGIVDFPDQKELSHFLRRTQDVTEELADAGMKMFRDYNPDLFFITFLTLDRVKHFLWRYTDENDIYYPGANSYKDAIKDFYILFDSIVGNIKNMLPEKTILLVISDHGHRRRCSKCLNLNEIFRQKGYLKTTGNRASSALKKLLEQAKVSTISSLSRAGYEDWIYRIAKFIPNRKALKKSTYLIDRNSSAISLSNMCGTNPYGGVDVKTGDTEEYEKLRTEIISVLYNLNETLGEPVVKWVGRREDLYMGVNDKRLPDVLFELYEDYGVGMDLYTSFITENFTHKKISGGHNREAVLLIDHNNNDEVRTKRPDTLIGIRNYILGVLSIP